MKRRSVEWGFLILGFFVAIARAESLDVSVGKLNVRITAISPAVFRVSLNADGPAPAIPSVFLDPNLVVSDPGKTSEKNRLQRIKTDAGEVEVDPTKGTYSLIDAH